MDAKARLFEILLARSFRRGDFVLASGKRSSTYLDCRLTTLDPEGMSLVGQLLYERYRALWPDAGGACVAAIAGPSIGADPITVSVCQEAWAKGEALFGLLVRKEAKGHGTGRQVEGADNVPAGSKVLLVEDVVTSGGSSMKSVIALREAGYEVVQALCLVDRGAGGAERFAEAGVPFEALYDFEEFLKA
jgi:orotate phosphoribosyltransferase